MPPPPEGVGTSGTFENDQVTIPDEEGFSSSERYQDDEGASRMELDRAIDSARRDSRSKEMLVSDTASQKNHPVKLFNLMTDKYNSDFIYVFIEKTNEENLGRLHPLVVGHILHKKLLVKNIVNIKSAGKNRVKVHFSSTRDANLLVTNKLLEVEKLRAFIPNHLLEKKGLIRGVDTFFNDDYLKENLVSPAKITNVQRVHRKIINENKVALVAKQSVIVTFEGNMLPNEIIINSVVFPVELFVGRVTQCYNCLKYGHISKQCRTNNPLCLNCGKSKSESHECFEKDTYCIYCKINDHKSNSRKCPFFEKQKKIKRVMVEHNSTYTEAKEYCENSIANFTSPNRFNILPDPNNYEINFPPLLKKKSAMSSTTKSVSQTQPKHRTYVSLSQPSTSSTYNPNLNKKRKISPPSPTPPMFPFRFCGSSPIPPNPNTPTYHLEQNKILESVSNFIIDLVKKIKSLDDIKKIDPEGIKHDINMVLKNTCTPK